MNPSRSLFVFVLGLSLTVIGCGGSESPPSDSADGADGDQPTACDLLEESNDSLLPGSWLQDTLSTSKTITFKYNGDYAQNTFLQGETTPSQTTEGQYTTSCGVLSRITESWVLENAFYGSQGKK